MPEGADPDITTNSSREPVNVSMYDGALLRGYAWRPFAPAPKGRWAKARHSVPLLCVASEDGNSRSFEQFIEQSFELEGCQDSIYSFDPRGCGDSEESSSNEYTIAGAADDLLSYCDALGLHHIDIVVNGNGIGVLLKALIKRPGFVRRLILNDASPEFDGVGVARHTAIGRRISEPQTWDEAVSALKELHGNQFPKYGDADWRRLAEIKWVEVDGQLVRDCDPALLEQTEGRDFHDRQEVYWAEFLLLLKTPVLLIRGEHSEYLTPEIADRMLEIHPNLEIETAEGQGHVPSLHFDDLPQTILTFLTETTLPETHPESAH